jgi:hypothetical protein
MPHSVVEFVSTLKTKPSAGTFQIYGARLLSMFFLHFENFRPNQMSVAFVEGWPIKSSSKITKEF